MKVLRLKQHGVEVLANGCSVLSLLTIFQYIPVSVKLPFPVPLQKINRSSRWICHFWKGFDGVSAYAQIEPGKLYLQERNVDIEEICGILHLTLIR